MKRLKKTFSISLIITGALVQFLNGTAVAGDRSARSAGEGPVGETTLSPFEVSWRPAVDYSRADLTVSGPFGSQFKREFAAGQSIVLNIADLAHTELADGQYRYELTFSPSLDQEVLDALEKARSTGDEDAIVQLRMSGALPSSPMVHSGSFMILDGAVVLEKNGERAVAKDVVHPDDVIAQFSMCIGNDCVNGENFGFDTLRLKENNTRLHFDDTSTSASFPRNDWRIIANDSSNGGGEYLAIEDSTAGRQVFRVEAGARANALYVEADGDIGIGTNNPAVDVDLKTGNTPTFRLQQDGTSGFTSQTWDMAANETNFFIRDVTNGSKLPFRIRPGSPDSMIDIHSDGVGVGTSNPDAFLHVRRTDGTAQILVEEETSTVAERTLLRLKNMGFPRFVLEDANAAVQWLMATAGGGTFVFNKIGSGAIEFTLSGGGNLTIAGNLTQGSSREIKKAIEKLDGNQVLQQIAGLPVSRWSYKHDGAGISHVGPMAEDFHAAFGLGTDNRHISPLDVASVALLAVQGLKQENDMLSEENAELRERLERLETAVANLAN